MLRAFPYRNRRNGHADRGRPVAPVDYKDDLVRRCSTCAHKLRSPDSIQWVCGNEHSKFYSCYVLPSHSCRGWT